MKSKEQTQDRITKNIKKEKLIQMNEKKEVDEREREEKTIKRKKKIRKRTKESENELKSRN